MATWSALVEYVHRNYKVAEERDGMMRLVFDLGDLRSQGVFLWRQSLRDGQEQWVQIESAFASPESVDLRDVLVQAGSTVCGGVVIEADTLIFRHAVPLQDLDISEFERPLSLVVNTADSLERRFAGSDQY